jgi:hypothetical protein
MGTFASNPNTRVFYATHAVAVGDIAATGVRNSFSATGAATGTAAGNLMIAHGLQSVGVTTNFNLDEIFEIGQLAMYENYEEVPDIEVTFEKVLDGYSLIYHLGTVSATSPTLVGRSVARADMRMLVGLNTMEAMVTGAGNSGVAELYCSGLYINSLSYSLSTDGNLSESTTFVGNNKLWYSGSETGILTTGAGALISAFSSNVFGNDSPVGNGVAGSVLRRQNVVTGATGKTYGGRAYKTIIPSFIEGGTTATGYGTNAKYINDPSALNSTGPFLTSFNASVSLNRESIPALGKKGPYNRYVNFPVPVTLDIEMTATGGDNIDAAEEGDPTTGRNLSNHSVQFVLDDSTVLAFGNKNKLSSISYGGGDAGGGNKTITYSMTNNNDFVVLHSGDPALATITSANYWLAYI